MKKVYIILLLGTLYPSLLFLLGSLDTGNYQIYIPLTIVFLIPPVILSILILKNFDNRIYKVVAVSYMIIMYLVLVGLIGSKIFGDNIEKGAFKTFAEQNVGTYTDGNAEILITGTGHHKDSYYLNVVEVADSQTPNNLKLYPYTGSKDSTFVETVGCGGREYIFEENGSITVYKKFESGIGLEWSCNRVHVGNFIKSFRSPSDYTDPIVDGAVIERINIPNCDNCYADIVLEMQGLNEGQVTKLNEYLTSSIFGEKVDIRDRVKRKIHQDVSLVSYQGEIRYAKNGTISYTTKYEIDYEGATHPSRDLGYLEHVIDFKNGSGVYHAPLFGSGYNDNKNVEQKVLNHFYPRGPEVFKTITRNSELQECYNGQYFPESFKSSLSATVKEVIFSLDYPYALYGACEGDLMIAIPVTDIMTEVPELVPTNSVLRRFINI